MIRNNHIDVQYQANWRNRRFHRAIHEMVLTENGNYISWRYLWNIWKLIKVTKFPTVIITGDGNVHIVDKEENVWPLRRFMGKILVSIIKDEFAVSNLTFTEDLSKHFN